MSDSSARDSSRSASPPPASSSRPVKRPAEDDGPSGRKPAAVKLRACDLCRKRKHRCDNVDRSSKTCFECRKAKTNCTFDAPSVPRAPPKAYVQKLEALVAEQQSGSNSAGPSSSNPPYNSSAAPAVSLSSENPYLTLPTPSDQQYPQPQLYHPHPHAYPSYPQDPSQYQQPHPVNSPYQYHPPPHASYQNHDLRSTSLNSGQPLPSNSPHFQPQQPYQNTSANFGQALPSNPQHFQPQQPYQHQPPSHPPSRPPSAVPSASASNGSPKFSSPRSFVLPPIGSLSRTSSSGTTQLKGPEILSQHQDDSRLQSFVQIDRVRHVDHASYIGRSSGVPLYIQALDMKWNGWTCRDNGIIPLISDPVRSIYWKTPEWQNTDNVFSADRIWPSAAEAAILIDSHFHRQEEWTPLLDRLEFDRMYAERTFDNSIGFKKVCLLVFALGARGLSEDQRFWMPKSASALGGKEGEVKTWGRLSSGWHFFHAHEGLTSVRPAHTQLFDLQIASLHVSFTPDLAVLAQGLHFAYDVGAHRKGFVRVTSPVTQEAFRRAFWVLYVQEKELSGIYGRPSMIHDEDFDVGLPLDCDDEYKQTAGPSSPVYFQQPEDTPSKIASFVFLISLHEISSVALSFFYAAKPPPFSISPADMVDVLSKRLDAWKASLPMQNVLLSLRYDPTRPNDIFFRQSAGLQVSYNLVVSYIHRPFLPTPPKLDQSSPESVQACLSAAISTAKIAEKILLKTNEAPGHLFTCVNGAAYILLHIGWNEACFDASVRTDAFAHAARCVAFLAEREKSDWIAGRGADALRNLIKPRPEASEYIGLPPSSPQWPRSGSPTDSRRMQSPNPILQSQHASSSFIQPTHDASFDNTIDPSEDFLASLFGGQTDDFWWQREGTL